jgi:hypothetical protein
MTSRAKTDSDHGHKGVRVGLIVLIAGLIVILAALLLNLVPLVTGTQARPGTRSVAASHRGVESTVSMPGAETRARDRALSWASDLQLIRVQATWYPGENWQAMDSPPVAWTFYYYSPAAGSIGAATIDDEKLLWVPPFVTPGAPMAIGDFPPPFGVDAAWFNLLAVGGEDFLAAHPYAQVTFRLQPQGERLLWTVSALDEGASVRVLVDAHTGIIVNQEP